MENLETPPTIRTVKPTGNVDVAPTEPEPARKRKMAKPAATADVDGAPKKRGEDLTRSYQCSFDHISRNPLDALENEYVMKLTELLPQHGRIKKNLHLRPRFPYEFLSYVMFLKSVAHPIAHIQLTRVIPSRNVP